VQRRFLFTSAQGELDSFVQTSKPDVLLVSTTNPQQMEAAIQRARKVSPGIQIVLTDSKQQSQTLSRAMSLGVRECVTAPFDTDELREALLRSASRRRAVAQRPTSTTLYSFFPAKHGVGATTLAIQTALSLPSEHNNKALLIDADLQAGMMPFLLKLQVNYGLIDALERCQELDESLWYALVAKVGSVDVLQSGDTGLDYKVDLMGVQFLLNFARQMYSTVLVDLPSAINTLTTHLLQQSERIFLVTAPDVASVHMTKVRLRQLNDLHLGSRISVVLNRQEQRGGMSQAELQSLIGSPVAASFVNDNDAVQKALLSGPKVDSGRKLRAQLLSFAESLRAPAGTGPIEGSRRFRDMFFVPKVRVA
jgi:pilus assembly protein CpaE